MVLSVMMGRSPIWRKERKTQFLGYKRIFIVPMNLAVFVYLFKHLISTILKAQPLSYYGTISCVSLCWHFSFVMMEYLSVPAQGSAGLCIQVYLVAGVRGRVHPIWTTFNFCVHVKCISGKNFNTSHNNVLHGRLRKNRPTAFLKNY